MSKYVITSGSVPKVALTWDPDDKGSTAVLSMGNTIANSYKSVGVRGNIGISSGKAYLEYTLLANVNSYVLGVSALNSNFDYNSTGVVAYSSYDGTKVIDIAANNYGKSFTSGDVIGMALDMDSNTITFYKNGVSQGPISYDFKKYGTVYPFYANGTTGTNTSLYINGGGVPFKYPIPTGYSPWGLYRLKQNISEIAIGDYISCEYIATANSVGTFSNLGKATKTLIPVASSPTPDGTFYFIMVGYDSRGRKKLVADRNVQHSMSWDTLNTAGIASGSGLPIVIDGWDKMYTMRLLSGGVSAADKDNEWDKIVVESTLNETIPAGDNAVWNWLLPGTYTICSTTCSTTSATQRVFRGFGTGVSAYSPGSTATADPSRGFRPVLIVEDTTKVTISKVTPLHLYGTQHVGLQIEASASHINVAKDFKIRVNGVDVDFYGPTTTRNISMDKFVVGDNTISAVAADGGAASITVILETPYRLIVNRTFNNYEGGYEISNAVLDGSAKAIVPYTPELTKTLLGAGAVYSFNIDSNVIKVEVS